MSDQYDGPAMAQTIIRLRAELRILKAERDAAEAERDALQADAERYRWLRECDASRNQTKDDTHG